MAKKFEIKPKDAAVLEEIEKRESIRRRTEKALFIATVPKRIQDKYNEVRGKIIAGRMNDNASREKVLKKIYKYNGRGQNIADAMVRE